MPVTLVIAEELELPPYPFLFAEIFASNIGGTATLIGDPPNILIGSQAGLGFNAFLVNVAPVALIVIMVVQTAFMHSSGAARCARARKAASWSWA